MAKKQARRVPSVPKEPRRFLGCFDFEEPGERDRSGSFQIIVDADGPEQAVERFRSRIRKLRTTSTLFDEPTTIYLNGVLELKGTFEKGLLVNYDAGDAPPPPNAHIMCLVPEQNDHDVVEYGYDPRGKRGKRRKGDDTVEPFIDFGGEGMRAALRRARGDESHTAQATHSTMPRIPPVNVRRPPTSEPSKAAARRAEAQARKERRAALAATLAEVGAPTKP